MYDQTNTQNPRRLSMTNNKSRSNSSSSTIFKRQSSGYIPLLTTNSRPLSNSTNFPQRSIINNKAKRKTEEYENDPFEYDVPTSNYASVRKQQSQLSTIKRIKPDQSTAPKMKLLPEDNSLRLVTSTVQGMKHWTNKNLSYPILFEIFGKLDSQITSLSLNNTRQFSLIDDKDRIECIYAEMDQSFSNIDRDVQLRIICRLESENTIARCIAIRVANKDEWHERHAIIQQCDIQLNEDDLNSKKLKKNNKKLHK
ncbi:unnamed protein product [Adineta steineri]|uniref:Uncharacterized protein n=1 Tax=Adineta steineri TaxID=433720 RepID=A0A819UVZ4_9BILA|nr:unnamed protein product [Adineta steineri]CAF4103669.1 unnamed protein product [Adineta steineri]